MSYPTPSSIKHHLNLFFVRQTFIPITSIFLFFITFLLNLIQFFNFDLPNKSPLFFLLFYDFLGINGFVSNGIPLQLFLLLLSYSALALIELWSGSLRILFFLLMDLFFKVFISLFLPAHCEGQILFDLSTTPFCCGSFLMVAAFGSVLFIIHQRVSILPLLFFVYLIILCYDYFIQFADSDYKNCKFMAWHALNYLLGILCIQITLPIPTLLYFPIDGMIN